MRTQYSACRCGCSPGQEPSRRGFFDFLRAIVRGRMRIALMSAVLFIFMALGVVGLGLRQPTVRFDEAIFVRVSPDHYEIAGKRFDGSLADQLDRYALTNRRVSILIIGADNVIKARSPELNHLRRNPHIHIAVFSSHVTP